MTELPQVPPCPTAAQLARRMLDDPATHYGDDAQAILERIAAGEPSGSRADAYLLAEATTGEQLADRVAAVGGSWGFIMAFGVVLIIWVLINSGLGKRVGIEFDPYPFIFLNLMLSMLAAIQAPIIMMSQNRQSTKDRLAARLDFETNLRAELDIERLHYKLDALLAERKPN
ncbi:MAG: DUF1003 domain-containing protein [Sphingomicrobium sp.]